MTGAGGTGPPRAPERPWRGRRLHLVGVGGAGMSGYARAAHALGAQLSGSDQASSPALERLRGEGVVDARVGHRGANLPEGDRVELIYSSAIPRDNAERVAARARGIAERPRAALLAELSALRRSIAVAGTHGKTTTAAMLVHALRGAGADPGWLVGSSVGGGLPNAHWSEGEWLVVEADESDRSMLSLEVEVAVLTNVELDHHASFASLEELRAAFAQFLASARGAIVLWDRPELLELLPTPALARVVAYDMPDPELRGGRARFTWRGREVHLRLPGAHNALNAVAALEATRLAGLHDDGTARDPETDGAAGHQLDGAVGGLEAFTGAGRRFERVGRTRAGALVYDDYAHHPTEIVATLRAARTFEPARVVAVFQPHLFSRTALLAREFGRALAQADVVAVLEVYPARERAEDHPGVSGLTIARTTAEAARGGRVYWLPRMEEASRVLGGELERDDLCVTMGAGDIDRLARGLVSQ
ncbi:MAG: UDP-N-acetylmuramate--L-alanine ligase [Solirubrobacterales bacterium]|nr:UDP-N-acetylmuramate--L-alanine ligase [Solirubrobacterales bacterium]